MSVKIVYASMIFCLVFTSSTAQTLDLASLSTYAKSSSISELKDVLFGLPSLPHIPIVNLLQSLASPNTLANMVRDVIGYIETVSTVIVNVLRTGQAPTAGVAALDAALQGYNALGAALVAAIGENLRQGNIGNALPYIAALEQLTSAYSNVTRQMATLPANSAITQMITQSAQHLASYAKQLQSLMMTIPSEFAQAATQALKGVFGSFGSVLDQIGQATGLQMPTIPSLPNLTNFLPNVPKLPPSVPNIPGLSINPPKIPGLPFFG